MDGFDAQDAHGYILSRIDPKAFPFLPSTLSGAISAFLQYDLHFMRLTGVLDEGGCRGEHAYDEDEAFEYIFDTYLSDSPCDDDEAMRVASLLNRYMELQYEYLKKHGLAED